ncbi:DNA topoisomerase family protein [Volucribacter amazonae]|uniref:DNA topoisomerase type IA zn finger domain-containing protein n=1 Tax=Volucribacter amazonae TaxID=256731 RepID=A0A9X4PBF2_9PAST|nr:topoisomerase DNA-binding C4 zinc finger domain-containing protein [Volucribacter amazonae]MDG6895177.1 hypothetical protein [Volucribacter amazonae]
MANQLFTPTKQTNLCPQCGATLQIKQGKKGLFLGCSAYPQCDYLQPLHHSPENKILKHLDEQCPDCGHHLVLKQGHFGMFIGCSNYPACHFIVQDNPNETPQKQIDCPECRQGHLVARRGRQGKTFYACDRYPKCKFTLPSKPIQLACPQCHYPLSIEKKTTVYQCANKQCKHTFTTNED